MTTTTEAISTYGGVAGKGTRGRGCILCGAPLRRGPAAWECGDDACAAFGKQVAFKRTHDPRPERYDVLLDKWRKENGYTLPGQGDVMPKCTSCAIVASGEARLALVETAGHRIMAHCPPGEGCLAVPS